MRLQTLTRLGAHGFAAWTFWHLFAIVRDHAGCDGCGHQPWSETWVIAARLGAWGLAAVALGRADDRPTRERLAAAACAVAALAAAMLLLPTPPPTGGGE